MVTFQIKYSAQRLHKTVQRLLISFFFSLLFFLDISSGTFCVSKRTQQWNISDRRVFPEQNFGRGEWASVATAEAKLVFTQAPSDVGGGGGGGIRRAKWAV